MNTNKLSLPMDKRDNFSFKDDIKKKLMEDFSTLEDKIDVIAVDYLEKHENVSEMEVVKLLAATYETYVLAFEYKRDVEKVELLDEETKIYDFCRDQLEEYKSFVPPNGLFSLLWRGIECVRNLVDAGKEWFGLASDKDKANNALALSGHKILPLYGTLLEAVFISFVDLLKPTTYLINPYPIPIEIAEGQALCAMLNKIHGTSDPDKNMASTMLRLAEYGFSGAAEDEEYIPLPEDEVPDNIRAIYDAEKGFLCSSRGLKAWIAKPKNENDDSIVISFSGTHMDDAEHILADIFQLFSPSVIYLMAVGLLNMFATPECSSTIYVTGHSMGGGLMQFAVAACGSIKNSSNIFGYGYNPAGLSSASVTPISLQINDATKRIWMFTTCKDWVSPIGGKLGRITTLPEVKGSSGHSIDDVKECMKKYLENISIDVDTSHIEMKALQHNESDFFLSSHKMSLSTSENDWLPIFAEDYSTVLDSWAFGKIYKTIYEQLNLTTKDNRECFGVIDKLNGTSYTVIRRLFALGFEIEMDENDFGLIASTMFYGKYGMGIAKFEKEIIEAYTASEMIFDAEERQHMEEIISDLSDSLEDERSAWINGAWRFFGMDLLHHLEAYTEMEKALKNYLIKNLSDRTDGYDTLMEKTQNNPSDEDIKAFIISYGNQFVLNAEDYFLTPGVECGMFTSDEFQKIRSGLSDFVNTIISNI